MRASTTTDSPSPRCRHTKTSIVTLVAFCALAAATQALAPASASAVVNQVGTAGGCTVTINVEGKLEGRTSGGQLCPLTDQLLFAAAANGRLGDVYYPTGIVPKEVPCPVAELCLPGEFGSKDSSGEPQHVGVLGKALGKAGKWVVGKVRKKKNWPKPKPKPEAPKPKLTQAPLSPECIALLAKVIATSDKFKEALQEMLRWVDYQHRFPGHFADLSAGRLQTETAFENALKEFTKNCPGSGLEKWFMAN